MVTLFTTQIITSTLLGNPHIPGNLFTVCPIFGFFETYFENQAILCFKNGLSPASFLSIFSRFQPNINPNFTQK